MNIIMYSFFALSVVSVAVLEAEVLCLFKLDFNGWSQRYHNHIAMKSGRSFHGHRMMVVVISVASDLLFGSAIRSEFPVDQHFDTYTSAMSSHKFK